jgi:hypothetical protein
MLSRPPSSVSSRNLDIRGRASPAWDSYTYRREHDVPLKELRDFIDRLREEFQVPYPLADRRPTSARAAAC